jgi:hypothetical protein
MSDIIAATGQGKEVDRQESAPKSGEPVDTSEVADFLDVIKEPIDLSTIEKYVRQDNHYKSKFKSFADLMLMVNNCKLYNEQVSLYVQRVVNWNSF